LRDGDLADRRPAGAVARSSIRARDAAPDAPLKRRELDPARVLRVARRSVYPLDPHERAPFRGGGGGGGRGCGGLGLSDGIAAEQGGSGDDDGAKCVDGSHVVPPLGRFVSTEDRRIQASGLHRGRPPEWVTSIPSLWSELTRHRFALD